MSDLTARALADPVTVQIVTEGATRGIEDLERYGMHFAREQNGRISQRFFGAHTFRRIAFATGSTPARIRRRPAGRCRIGGSLRGAIIRNELRQWMRRSSSGVLSKGSKLAIVSVPHRLKCAETWASNQETSSVADLPGLRVWVHSTPFGSGQAGGDVHYVSVCPSCIVSRIALADVSGHGSAVVSLSAKLRELMQKYLTALEQTNLMRDLNEAVMAELDGVHYATMVAAGFHGRRGLLVMTNAGHPPAFWYRANRDEWAWLEPHRAEGGVGVRGTPLGLLPNVSYDRMIVKPEPGDLLVLYSDGVSEATNPAGKELGRDDLMTLARALDPMSAETFGMQLVEAVSEFRGGSVPEDDETIIVLERPPDQSG